MSTSEAPSVEAATARAIAAYKTAALARLRVEQAEAALTLRLARDIDIDAYLEATAAIDVDIDARLGRDSDIELADSITARVMAATADL